jgi:hypothetical protein
MGGGSYDLLFPGRVKPRTQAADVLLAVDDEPAAGVAEEDVDDELSLGLLSELLLLAAGALLDEEPRLSVR